ncbi:MAG: hypothetical protein H6591_02635 [Flavobacteriales bacterium]|nr:hypothetical protein [Flavobacteriales bacterium]
MIRSSLALLLSLQLLLAGVPWTVRTHWCGGHIAGWSMLGDQPGCGMEEGAADCASEIPALGAVPCCANEVLQVEAVPSFVKVVQERTVVAPDAVVIPMITLEPALVDQRYSDHRAHPPDIVPTGRDILVCVQRFLI